MSIIQLFYQISSLPRDLQKKVGAYTDSLISQSKKSRVDNGRIAGLAKGMIKMYDNFDDPIEDFQGYM